MHQLWLDGPEGGLTVATFSHSYDPDRGIDGGKKGTVIGHLYDKVLVCWHEKAEERGWDSLKIAPAVTP